MKKICTIALVLFATVNLFAGLESGEINEEDKLYFQHTDGKQIVMDYAQKFVRNTPMEIDQMTTLESVVGMPDDLLIVLNKSIKTTENAKMTEVFTSKEETNILKKKLFEEEKTILCSEPFTNQMIMTKLITFSFVYKDSVTNRILFRYSVHSKDCSK